MVIAAVLAVFIGIDTFPAVQAREGVVDKGTATVVTAIMIALDAFVHGPFAQFVAFVFLIVAIVVIGIVIVVLIVVIVAFFAQWCTGNAFIARQDGFVKVGKAVTVILRLKRIGIGRDGAFVVVKGTQVNVLAFRAVRSNVETVAIVVIVIVVAIVVVVSSKGG